MLNDEESNQQLKNHKIPLQGGGRNLLPNGVRLEISGGGRTSPHLYTEWLLKMSNHPHQTQNRHPGGFSEGRRVCRVAQELLSTNESYFPLQGGGKEFVSECNELTNSGGGQLCASHQNDYVTLNLFQGLANVTVGDDLNNKTAVALLTPHQERLNSQCSSSLSILSRKGRGERHPAAGCEQRHECPTIHDVGLKPDLCLKHFVPPLPYPLPRRGEGEVALTAQCNNSSLVTVHRSQRTSLARTSLAVTQSIRVGYASPPPRN